tara:strand:- start:793 stop:1620 length:828 start_codon:yes stop_codon:yes gene_type:complete
LRKRSCKIEAIEVEKVFSADSEDEVHALGPLDLQVQDGEFVCLVGPSGCGKSTFLRIVAGLLNPTTGRVDIGINPENPTPISMVFQDYGIYPWKTVEGNIRFGLEISGISKSRTKEVAGHWLERMDLTAFAGSYPDTLSGGMRQRVAIARALAVEPEILLMDEPFAALDAQLRQLLQDELLAIWQKEQRTVLFVTHSLEEAIVLGDRVIVMSSRPGKIVLDQKVPFERPRSPELRAQSDFNEFKNELWLCLKGEVEHYLERVNSVEGKIGSNDEG